MAGLDGAIGGSVKKGEQQSERSHLRHALVTYTLQRLHEDERTGGEVG